MPSLNLPTPAHISSNSQAADISIASTYPSGTVIQATSSSSISDPSPPTFGQTHDSGYGPTVKDKVMGFMMHNHIVINTFIAGMYL